MSEPTPPQPGQPLWGDDLNTYLLSLEARIANNEVRFTAAEDTVEAFDARIAAVEASVTSMESTVAALNTRVSAVEARSELIYNSYPWQFSNLAPPATGNQVRLDNVDLKLATQIDIRKEDADGADRTPVFQALDPGSTIRINDWNDAALLHRYEVTGPPMIGATNVQIPVTWVSGNGVIPNAKANVAFLIKLKEI